MDPTRHIVELAERVEHDPKAWAELSGHETVAVALLLEELERLPRIYHYPLTRSLALRQALNATVELGPEWIVAIRDARHIRWSGRRD